MTETPSAIDGNRAASERLRALLDGLSDAELGRDVGGGWTVGVVLGHLAFWDGRQAAALRHHGSGGELITSERPGRDNPDAITNRALEPLLLALEPRAALELALLAAEAVDQAVRGLAPEVLSAIEAAEHAYLARRYVHREEHIAQIEQALGR